MPRVRPQLNTSVADLDQARAWAAAFVHWYNVEHHHSGIGYVSPAARHAGDDVAILAVRHALYTQARVGVVTLNPERDAVIAAHLAVTDKQPLAA